MRDQEWDLSQNESNRNVKELPNVVVKILLNQNKENNLNWVHFTILTTIGINTIAWITYEDPAEFVKICIKVKVIQLPTFLIQIWIGSLIIGIDFTNSSFTFSIYVHKLLSQKSLFKVSQKTIGNPKLFNQTWKDFNTDFERQKIFAFSKVFSNLLCHFNFYTELQK